jgi:hypothetical protein
VRNRFFGSILRAAAVLVVSAVLVSCSAQRSETGKTASAPSTPDLSGVWLQRAPGDTFTKDVPPLQPWAVERTAANVKAGKLEDPETRCFPTGMPRIYVHQYPIEILQSPGRILMLFEYDHFVRQIWMDGRKHPKEEELEHTWMGHSIGSWEGDTLVVDSVGFNDKTWLDTLQIDFTFDDPKAYTKPWTGQRMFRFRPGWEISEQVCADNFLWKEPGK